MSNTLAIVWFRKDLRLRDNPALNHARHHYDQVLPVFIWDEMGEGDWVPGGASRWWLHHSLMALDESLHQRGSGLLVFKGDSERILSGLVDKTQADAVFWNRRYEPAVQRRDQRVRERLRESTSTHPVDCRNFNGALWWEPWELQTTSGQPYKVFTPLWKRMLNEWRVPEILPKPQEVRTPGRYLAGNSATPLIPQQCSIHELNLLPKLNWAASFPDYWQPGEQGARRRLLRFIDQSVTAYQDKRDIPELDATSGLSAHLHFGELSPRQIVVACAQEDGSPPATKGALGFIREVAWREFSQHLLYHFPDTPTQPLNERFENFPWRQTYSEDLRRWQRGQTGIPLVDAGMRQLWHCGWMHNRVRMVVASYLTKNLLIPWQEGARWFWDTLVDADLANNTQGWQWTAGCGADAAPYFRVFNPVSQGERFDPQGGYVRHWVQELHALPDRYLHCPWTAPEGVLRAAGVTLGQHYPQPQVDLKATRSRALEAYRETKTAA